MKMTTHLALLLLIPGISCADNGSLAETPATEISEHARILIAISPGDESWGDDPRKIREKIEQSLGEPFSGSLIIEPDEGMTTKEASIWSDLDTFVFCNAVLTNGKPGEASCYRIDEHKENNIIELKGAIVVQPNEETTTTESSIVDQASGLVMCSAFLNDGKTEHTSCTRFDSPK